MKIQKISVFVMLGIILTGCESRIDVVNQEMANIRNQPPVPIEPAPDFIPVDSFAYGAQQLRSPFLPSSLAAELKVMAGKRVYPNFNRQQQPLESFPIENLNMKGSLLNQSGKIMALIQTPDGQVERVQVGNYMGLNHGRIVKITPTQIDVVEIIPDGREGYVERPRSLILIGPAP
ncbi:pilus assembly protein PilP [Acinetobacter johnsonii]|nr:pilus assembly protein PilP [Acinetobacter johnsonii]